MDSPQNHSANLAPPNGAYIVPAPPGDEEIELSLILPAFQESRNIQNMLRLAASTPSRDFR